MSYKKYISGSQFNATLLLVALLSVSCGGRKYYSGNLREEGVFGRVASIKSQTYMANEDGEKVVKQGKVIDEYITGFDERGVRILNSNSGRSGNYKMTFEPEYSTEGVLLGGRYKSSDILLFTRRLNYDSKQRVLSAINIDEAGVSIDSMMYEYGGRKEYCVSSGTIGETNVRMVYSSKGLAVSKSETDGQSYLIDYVYDKQGRLIEKIFSSKARQEQGSEQNRENPFVAEYTVKYVYDKRGNLIEETKSSNLVKDGFDYSTIYAYDEFDSHGNWLRRTQQSVYADTNDVYYITLREIEYYKQ